MVWNITNPIGQAAMIGLCAAGFLLVLVITLYILITIRLEERDLVTVHGEAYANYRTTVPMLVPSFNRRVADAVELGTDRVTMARTLGGAR